MKKFLTVTLVALFIAMLFIPSYSQGMKIKNKDFQIVKQKEVKIFADDLGFLNLTDDQKDKIDDLRAEQHKNLIELRYKLALKNFELNELMRKSPDEKKALKIVEEIGKIKLDIEKSRITNHFKIRSLLTDEQKKLFDKHFGFNRGWGFGMNYKDGFGKNRGMGFNGDCPFLGDDNEDEED
ncbi:MAG: Spy/CpxP family protein refolding chaperone [candidate division WOR-3 bacterium]